MEKEIIYALLEEIRMMIRENDLQDGTFRFDQKRVRIALEFAKLEIQESIRKKETD